MATIDELESRLRLLLPALRQDVTTIRDDVIALRRGQEELHTRLDRLEGKLNAILAVVAPRGPAS